MAKRLNEFGLKALSIAIRFRYPALEKPLSCYFDFYEDHFKYSFGAADYILFFLQAEFRLDKFELLA